LTEGSEYAISRGGFAVYPLVEDRYFVRLTTLKGIPCLFHFTLHHKPFGRALKRLFDLLASAVLLLLLSPLFLLISILIKLDSEGPVFFSQVRVGRNGRKFRMWKFRTMRVDAEEVLKSDPELYEEFKKSFKLKNDPRITRFGKFLRETSLDELPQLWNVLLGDMSLVGPRPVVEPELEKYGRYKKFYLSVRPGITGLWQISGRSDLDYTIRVSLDVFYVLNWSPLLDLKILALTPAAVLKKKGAY
jgi:undecaprenyl-phosphate galactose phosphotransferase